MSSTMIEGGLIVLEFSRRALLGMLEDIPKDRWVHQPITTANHAAWIVGHLAHTDNFFLTSVAGRPSQIPAEWDSLFGMGSQPVGDASAYPNSAELKDQLRARREDLIAWLRGLSEAQAQSELPEELRVFAPSVGALPNSIAWHEGMHTGQLTVVRKSLGIAPKFG
jgi:uncharacterized damage-inducible protein DinB